MSSMPVPICCASASAADAGAVGDQPFREAFRDDVLHFLPDQFVAAVAELFLRLHIQQDDLSAWFTTTMASGAASSSPR